MENKPITIELKGIKAKCFEAVRTNDEEDGEAERHKPVGIFTLKNRVFIYTVPSGSVTTFFVK